MINFISYFDKEKVYVTLCQRNCMKIFLFFSSHALQCKILSKITQAVIIILKISMIIFLFNEPLRNDKRNPTIHYDIWTWPLYIEYLRNRTWGFVKFLVLRGKYNILTMSQRIRRRQRFILIDNRHVSYAVILLLSMHDTKIYHVGPSRYVSRMAGFSLFVSNTTSKDDGHLCFHEIQNVSGTPLEDQRINCSLHGRYVIYYNERDPDVIYPGYYSQYAINELCEVEVYGKFMDISRLNI